MNVIVGSVMLVIAMPLAPTASAAPLAPAVATVDGRAAVTEIRRVLNQNYVLPEVRPKLDAALARGLADGRYAVSDPSILAARINEDLEKVAHDKHLSMAYDSAGAAELGSGPPGAGADDGPPTPQDIRSAEQGNHGIVQMKLLPGNIRYLEYNRFTWVGPSSAEALGDAMRFLRGGDAAIIDLRHNGGGSPDAVQYMISHFLAPNRPIVTFYMGGDRVDRRSSLTSLPAGRMVGKPLYVLTGGMTASAAEEFTGHVAGFKLGEIIGETTAGAGFRNAYFPVPGGFLLSVSVGRAVLTSTGKDWEGVGIAPTTKTAPDQALEVAQVHALRRLAATAPPDEKAALEASATLLAAKVDPVATALPLTAYTGKFGERTVWLENGKLAYRRDDGPKFTIIPIGANQFAFENDAMTRLEYAVSGNAATGFELIRNDGSRLVTKRAP